MDEDRINDSLVEKLKFGQDIKAEFFWVIDSPEALLVDNCLVPTVEMY